MLIIVVFNGDYMHFYIKNCKICIDYLFILVLSLAALFNANDILLVLLFSSLHEIGHFAALIIFKNYPYELKLSFYGFAVKYESNISRVKETVVLLSGPLVNLILYLILKDNVNLILFLLNVLPIYPLDFARVLRLYFPKTGTFISRITLILICILCVYMLVYYKSYSLLFVATYLVLYGINCD